VRLDDSRLRTSGGAVVLGSSIPRSERPFFSLVRWYAIRSELGRAVSTWCARSCVSTRSLQRTTGAN